MQITRTRNLILSTDSYKLTQWTQYPPNTRRIYSYSEARSNHVFPYVVNFGLQYYLKELEGVVLCDDDILEADDICAAHFNDPSRKIFNREGWKRLIGEYGGRVPLQIYGLDEGLKVPIHTPLFTMENSDDRFAWVTNPFETMLLKTWYTTTVCSNSHFTLNKIAKYLKMSAEDDYYNAFVKFMLQDFGARGCSSEETARLGGMAHLVNGWGTDTINALRDLRDYYHADLKNRMPGFSVGAMEHSTVTSWLTELASYQNAFKKFPTGILSIVVDSYDQREAIKTIFGEQLKATIVERGKNGLTVLRFDSGDPLVEVPACIELMMEKFGFHVNSKGYRELPPYIKALQGDGIDYYSIEKICQGLIDRKISLANIACFGEGGGLLQKVNRDDFGFALKCALIDDGGDERAVQKKPKSDPNKNSLAGRLVVKRVKNEIVTFQRQPKIMDDVVEDDGNLLKFRFRNGTLYNETDIYAIRERADAEYEAVA